MKRLILGTGAAGRLNSAAGIESLLTTCLRDGANTFDTAPLYGSGAMEALLGKVLKAQRAGPDVLVNTKFGIAPTVRFAHPERHYFAAKLAQATARRLGRNKPLALTATSAVAAATAALDQSTRLLGHDRIDVFFAHEIPVDIVATPDFVDFVKRAKANRLFRRFGLGGYRSIYHGKEGAESWSHVDVLQVESVTGLRPVIPPDWKGEIFLHGVLAPLRRPREDTVKDDALRECFLDALEVQGASELVIGVSRLVNFHRAADVLRTLAE